MATSELVRIPGGVAVALGTGMSKDSNGAVIVGAAGVTGAKIPGSALGLAVATGGNGAGARTATGLAVGDKVFGVISRGDAGAGNLNVTADFESTITVANQIQQLTTDLTSDLLTIFVVKA